MKEKKGKKIDLKFNMNVNLMKLVEKERVLIYFFWFFFSSGQV